MIEHWLPSRCRRIGNWFFILESGIEDGRNVWTFYFGRRGWQGGYFGWTGRKATKQPLSDM